MYNKKGTVLVTAGPTYERLDPVRFLGNFSTGKMGYAIAHVLLERAFHVKLVSGPTQSTISHPLVDVIHVLSAEEMYQEAQKYFQECELAFFVAAVSDYRPKHFFPQKMKKESGKPPIIELIRNTDIAKELGKQKKSHQLTIGFALETEDEEQYAYKKMRDKNLDYIVLNSLNTPGAGFSHDTNEVTILSRNGNTKHVPLQSKRVIAEKIVETVLQ